MEISFSDTLVFCFEVQVPKLLGTVEDDPLSVLLELVLLQQPVGGALLLHEGPVLLQLPQQVLQEVVGGDSGKVPLQF